MGLGPRLRRVPIPGSGSSTQYLIGATKGCEPQLIGTMRTGAMSVFISIQLPHVSCGVSEIALARESPVQRPSGRILLGRTTTDSDRSPEVDSRVRDIKWDPCASSVAVAPDAYGA